MNNDTRFVDAQIDDIDDELHTVKDAPGVHRGRPVVPALIALSLIVTGLLLCWWLWQNQPGAQAREYRATIERLVTEHQCAAGETVAIVDRGGWYKLTCEGGQHGGKRTR